jgi:hypothetical protein
VRHEGQRRDPGNKVELDYLINVFTGADGTFELETTPLKETALRVNAGRLG